MSDLFERQPGLTDTEFSIQETAHKFAHDVMRPAGIGIDRADPEKAFDDTSPYWNVRKQFLELGLHLADLQLEMSPSEFARIYNLVCEELAWGDYGLTGSFFAATFPAALARASQRQDLMEQFTYDQIGCWGLTEPNHGSDQLDYSQLVSPTPRDGAASDCVATLKGDRIIIKGQKSAWVTNGCIAETMSLFCRYEDGKTSNGRAAILVPLDLPGISRGKHLHKHGMRSLPDGEVFFDEVEVPASNLVFGPEQYPHVLGQVLTGGGGVVAAFNTGVARAAYELALSYARERVQGGKPIFEYDTVRMKLFNMYQKVTLARALSRHVMQDAAVSEMPSYPLAATAKVSSTEIAIEVAGMAFEVFGGNAVTQEYPIEKILRDARTGSIGEGQNDIVRLMASRQL